MKGTRSLRRGCYSARNQIYHITTTTYDRAPLFSSFALGRVVVDSLRREEALRRCDTLCFVVMPDHLHWLMQLAQASLSTCVNSVKACSARRINRLRSKNGPVWQKGFHDRALRRDEDIVAIARYIVANPLRAGLVEKVGDYPLWYSKWV